MTPLEKFIAESQQICDAATQAPWSNEENYNTIFSKKGLVCEAYEAETASGEAMICSNFKFIAHARTALPAALQHLRELSREIELLKVHNRELRALAIERDALTRRVDGLMVERNALSKAIDVANKSNDLLARRVAEFEQQL